MQNDSLTGNAIDSRVRSIRDAFWTEQPRLGRRAQVGAAVALTGLGAFALAGQLAAAGLGLLALAALVIAYERPYFLGPMVVLLVPAGEHVHVVGAQIAPLEAVVVGGAIGYLAQFGTRREIFHVRLADWAFAAFLACIALSTLGPVDDSDQIREFLFLGALGIVFHAVSTHLATRRDFKLMLLAFAVSGLVEASWAIVEYAQGWSARFSLLNGAIVYPLPNGTLTHPNALGQFLVLTVLAVLALAHPEKGTLQRFGHLAACAGSLALVVTFSRASWIALVFGGGVYLLERRTRAAAVIVTAVAAVAAASLALLDAGAIGARISSLFRTQAGLYEFRLEVVERSARIVAENPLTGAGHFEEAGVYAGRPDLATHPHNLFLGIAVFFGIPAAVAFGAIVVLAFRAAWNGRRSQEGSDRLVAVGFLGVIVAFLVNGLLEYPFWNPSLTALIVVLLAAASTLDQGHERLPSAASGRPSPD